VLLPNLEEIRKIREAVNVTQKALAEQVKVNGKPVSRVLINMIEMKGHYPNYKIAEAIFARLDQIENNKKSKARTAEKICTKNLVTVRPYESVHTAEKKMGPKGKYTRLPVLGGMGECVGLITSNSILKNPTARKVEEAMEPRPMIIDQDTVITQEIEALLYDTRSCILVSKRNSSSIMGIIEAWDLIPKKGKK
tara:strand:- start:59 stop:640 length:582 start_codon:yes stop_codon:yes gene_type:complete